MALSKIASRQRLGQDSAITLHWRSGTLWAFVGLKLNHYQTQFELHYLKASNTESTFFFSFGWKLEKAEILAFFHWAPLVLQHFTVKYFPNLIFWVKINRKKYSLVILVNLNLFPHEKLPAIISPAGKTNYLCRLPHYRLIWIFL